jgi:hypothetical protein
MEHMASADLAELDPGLASPGSSSGSGRQDRLGTAWWLPRLHPLTATLVFLALLYAVQRSLYVLSARQYDAAILRASTNLVNLEHGRLATLLTSAVVGGGGSTLRWWATVAAVLALGELCWGSLRLVVVFLAGHIGATALVAAGLAVGEWQGWLPTSLMSAPDVGVSYGMVAIVGALVSRLPRPVAFAWAGTWVLLLAREFLEYPNFTDAGHLCALAIGLVLARVLVRSGPRSDWERLKELGRHPRVRRLEPVAAALAAWGLFHTWIV